MAANLLAFDGRNQGRREWSHNASMTTTTPTTRGFRSSVSLSVMMKRPDGWAGPKSCRVTLLCELLVAHNLWSDLPQACTLYPQTFSFKIRHQLGQYTYIMTNPLKQYLTLNYLSSETFSLINLSAFYYFSLCFSAPVSSPDTLFHSTSKTLFSSYSSYPQTRTQHDCMRFYRINPRRPISFRSEKSPLACLIDR
ncbi:hypothetical protein BRADI_2g02083v3 [Brachypodium distachyon]|uniref:Uncharacterized protein n=1 Tax=Brachypodium distachyon TaxID=15368 RepID=A0A0Q3IQI3_BRADI|nr:hypothetical protein BRADI_2g02083v3 [Brachypodium distachyon]